MTVSPLLWKDRLAALATPLSVILLLPALALAQLAPAGTTISVRLRTAISTLNSRAADPLDAVVIAPVVVNGGTAIAPGAMLHGTIEKVTRPSGDTGRASLMLGFRQLHAGGVRRAVLARVAAVDNAREEVDDEGRINGILSSETITGRLDGELSRLDDRYSGLASILSAAKNDILHEASTDISYQPGVELTVRLVEAVTLPPGKPPPPVPVFAGRAELLRLIASEPFRAIAEHSARPSDITNLLLVCNENVLRRAFVHAGWSQAAKLTSLSKFQALVALAEDRGYSEAPVSVLLLDGKPPDIVFQKVNNTFARRHHVRIWRRPASFHGLPVWAAAATHDIGITFSDAARTFVHRIDPKIDREREKVIDDLRFAGHVTAIELVERPAVPRHGENATGDSFETDGRIAVLPLR